MKAEFTLGTLYPCAKIESDGMQDPVTARVKGALLFRREGIAMDAAAPPVFHALAVVKPSEEGSLECTRITKDMVFIARLRLFQMVGSLTFM